MPRSLLEGESLVFNPLRRHWIVLARDLVAPVSIGVVFLALFDIIGAGLGDATLHLLVTLVVMAIIGVWTLIAWIQWTAYSLTVTDQRVILESGVFRRFSKIIPLDRVQDVSTTQSLLGRILNYGLVEIAAAGLAGREQFPYCASPEELRDNVFWLSEQLRRGG